MSFLTDDGRKPRPNATVVRPADGSCDRTVERIVAAVRELCHVTLPVATAGDPIATPHRIALGCLANNRLIESLYFRWRTLVDRWYPGQGGYVAQMVLSPDAPGSHVLILGGSDADGVAGAAETWLSDLSAASGDGWLLRVKLGKGHLPLPKDRLDVDRKPVALGEKAEVMDFAAYQSGYRGGSIRDHLLRLGMYGPSAYNTHFCRSSQLGLRYLYTGRTEDGERYRRAFLAEIEQGITAGLYHYKSLRMFHVWAALEHCPMFSDDDRRLIVAAMRTYLLESSGVPSIPKLRKMTRSRDLFDRHLACEALNLWAGAEYFRKREPGGRWAEYRQVADDYFESHGDVDVPVTGLVEGYSTYLDVYLEWMLMSRPERIADSTQIRTWAERVVGLCTNAGCLIRGPQTEARRYPYHLMRRLAYLLDDGRYLFVSNLRERHVARADDLLCEFTAGPAYAGDICPCEPGAAVGLTVFPINERHRRLIAPDLAEGKGFDRAVGRAGWGVDDEYFAVVGAAGCIKPLPTTGALATYERLGVQMVVLPSKMLVAPENNPCGYPGVTVATDAPAVPLPRAAAVRGQWSLDGTDVFAFTVAAPGAYEWRRTLAWQPNGFLLVVDRVRVLAGKRFSAAAHWRVCQRMQRQGHMFSARVDSPEGRVCAFHVQLSEDADLLYEDSPSCRAMAEEFAHAHFPLIHAAIEGTTRERSQVELAALLHTTDGESGPAFRLMKQDDHWVVAGPERDRHFHGLVSDEPPSVTSAAAPPVRPVPPRAAEQAPAADAAVTLWTLPVEGAPSTWTVNAAGIAVGTTAGQVVAADEGGIARWQATLSSEVTAVTAVDADLIVGTRSGAVARLDSRGKRVWEARCGWREERAFWPWWFLKTPLVAAMAAVHDPESGRDVVMVGTGSSAVNVLDADSGRLVADRLNCYGTPEIVRACVMPDGALRFLTAGVTLTPSSAVSSWTATASQSPPEYYSGTGEDGLNVQGQWDQSGVAGLYVGRLRVGGEACLVVLRRGTSNELTCYDLASRAALWTTPLGGHPCALAVLNAEDAAELCCMGRYGWLWRLDAGGGLLWGRRLGVCFSGAAACADGRLALWGDGHCVQVAGETVRRFRLSGTALGWVALGEVEGMLTFDGQRVSLETMDDRPAPSR